MSRLLPYGLGIAALALLVAGFRPQPPPELVPATAPEILQAVQESAADVVVVNMWATWCAPCVEEFPDFVRLGREFADRGVDVVFVSVDFAEDAADVQAFLEQQGVEGTAYLKHGKDHEFVQAFHEDWSGAVPATFLFTKGGTLADYWQAKTDFQDLRRRTVALLDDDLK